jgi:hypothetical protein
MLSGNAIIIADQTIHTAIWTASSNEWRYAVTLQHGIQFTKNLGQFTSS